MRQTWVAGVVAVGLLAGCGSKESKETGAAAGDDYAGAPPATRHDARTAFVVPAAGIRFDPPADWDLARIRVDTKAGADAAAVQRGAEYCVSFEYRAEQPADHDRPLLRIAVYRRAAWDEIAGRSGASVGDVVGRNDDWVYVASLADTTPYREDSLDGEQFAAMILALDDVRHAFSIEGGGPSDPSLRADSKGP